MRELTPWVVVSEERERSVMIPNGGKAHNEQ